MAVARMLKVVLRKHIKVCSVVVKDLVRFTQCLTVASDITTTHEENTVRGSLHVLEIVLKSVGHICSASVQCVRTNFKL
jgi:hypothetical protein